MEKQMIITNKDILRQVISRNGNVHQTVVAIEEMSELTKELTKTIRGKYNHDSITEEMADVLICFWQLQEMYLIRDGELQEEIDRKLARLDKRVNGI